LNDLFLITTVPPNHRQSIFGHQSKISLHQALPLDQMKVRDLSLFNVNEDPKAFELITKERSYILIAESPYEKQLWLEELESAIYALLLSSDNSRKCGWFYDVVYTSFHSAIYSNDRISVSNYLQRHPGHHQDSIINGKDLAGMTPLHWAAFCGHLELVEWLLEKNANIQTLNAHNNTPLMLAAIMGHNEIVLCLLSKYEEQGFDLNYVNTHGYNAYKLAVIFGVNMSHSSHVTALLNAFHENQPGNQINAFDTSGGTLLHLCAIKELPTSIEVLAQAGADLNLPHQRTLWTPLQLVCSTTQPNIETIRALLENGARVNVRDRQNRTALDLLLLGLSSGTEDESSYYPLIAEMIQKGGRCSLETTQVLSLDCKVK
jgi:ankyrin repeat protein